MNVTVKYGKDTHGLVVDEAGTLGQLCNQLEAVTGVPRHLQKLVFKGKSVHPPSGGESDPPVLKVLKLREGCKLMLLGRKMDPAREELMVVLVKEDTAADAIAVELSGVEVQLNRVTQGFADHLGVDTACAPLQKKVAWCVDELEKGLERLDAAHCQASDRELRKASILKIQQVLTRADGVTDTIDKLLLKNAPAAEVAIDVD
eukprot:m.105335 g.105335  ORF g.105335 m.105335 type:complete len:203 (-) comp21007_c1_seq1:1345-1953(-)